ncbi:hypothetical protein [Rosenbergiella metrosideri]|nr:hypothetical protein [Rosenbergiella metrosideri]
MDIFLLRRGIDSTTMTSSAWGNTETTCKPIDGFAYSLTANP